MGQEISRIQFEQRHFDRFENRLAEETRLLSQWFAENRFCDDRFASGFELEVWIVDRNAKPQPINEKLIQTMANPMVTQELAAFNIEFNFGAETLKNSAFTHHREEMMQLWRHGSATAKNLDSQLAMIGILPTVKSTDLTMANVSSMKRYAALNEQVLRMRNGRPLRLDIHGNEILRLSHEDVMLESATTSFQIHLQVPISKALRAYNASIILSAPVVAVAANSPYLFGKNLWSETRIPLFEQSVEVGGYGDASQGPMRRVSFGSGYARESLMEIFEENYQHFPVLLPMLQQEPLEHFANVRLHNGTLWRWNRPLIGLGDKLPHIRIEHRVVPAGPTLEDNLANAAFYYGLVYALAQQQPAPETQLPFELARDNFYRAAQYGLDTNIVWLDGKKIKIQTLILKTLLPLAAKGLQRLQVDQTDIDRYLTIIESRTVNNCTGAEWQRAFVCRYGPDMEKLTTSYIENQESGLPVHNWGINR
ncbi:MAG: glutamate--cysteine ligase [Gammaproteobacteria bacterium]|nr:glutamate--cysteine ligase [Gammaproteobacteria bacterium]MDH5799585.1 glutamate--cysteine ligase [Gammaproteobacteria bacterium]